jgi:hypothetical protein
MNFWSYAKILRILPANGNGPLIGISGPFVHLPSYRRSVVRPINQASAVAYFVSPSAFSASCTFGRPLTRAI